MIFNKIIIDQSIRQGRRTGRRCCFLKANAALFLCNELQLQQQGEIEYNKGSSIETENINSNSSTKESSNKSALPNEPNRTEKSEDCPTCPVSNYIGGLSPGFNTDFERYIVNISDEKNFPWVKIYQTSAISKGTAVTLPGIGIVIHSDFKPGLLMTKILQHEYGHFLDFKFSIDLNAKIPGNLSNSFLNYYLLIGMPSIFDLVKGSNYEKHQQLFTERRADRWAEIWFGNNYKGK